MAQSITLHLTTVRIEELQTYYAVSAQWHVEGRSFGTAISY